MSDRIIKFRLWSNNKMTSWEELLKHARNFTDFDSLIGYFNNPDVGVLMQFTGLLDKNGKEIYEGDLFHCNYCDYHFLEVYYDGINAVFSLKSDNSDLCANAYLTKMYDLRGMEVIGNIYGLKELIK